jgi:NADH-quinone oxidoreductase subunit K
MMPIIHYLFLSVALLLIGVIGVFVRRNVVIVLLSIELILTAVILNLVAFASFFGDVAGQVFALFVLVVAVAQAAVGLAIVVHLFRQLEWYSAGQTLPSAASPAPEDR